MVASVNAATGADVPENLSPDTQLMTYQVYAGGINAVDAEMNIVYPEKGNYEILFKAKTRGFLAKLAPWWGSFESKGWRMADKEDRPKRHKSISSWRDEEDISEYNYNREGGFESFSITEVGVDKTPKNLDDELVKGTTDALTATLQVMMSVAEGNKCEGTSEVFDGKRRFALVYNGDGTENLKSSGYNLYDGAAEKCTVEVRPVAGKWHEKPRGWMSIQEQGRDKGLLPTVWMAKMNENGPAVPVKVRVKTDYGTLFMHLVKYQNGDKVIAIKD